jgi:[acyl-carrier-protein] S-malonyltransferase
MQSITADFQKAVERTPFAAPAIPVIGNVTAVPLHTVDEIRAELSAQLVSTVRWTESVQYMLAHGVDTVIELGPKDVLTGLLKRTDRDASRVTLSSTESVKAFLGSAS